MNNSNEANIPGAAGVIRTHGGAGFYCTVHKKEIQPLLVEVDDTEVACCEECALEDLIEGNGDVVYPKVDGISYGDDDEDGSVWDGLYT